VTVEFVGMIGASYYSESATPTGPAIDQAYLRRFARAYDEGGFDWTLVPYGSAAPESNQLAAAVLGRTERLKVMLAHRPGVLFPTNAARVFATLDQLSDGRLGIHFLAGGNDTEQRREGAGPANPGRDQAELHPEDPATGRQRGGPAECRFPAAAHRRGQGRTARPGTVDPDRHRDQRRRQLHRAGGQLPDGGRRPAGLRRHRLRTASPYVATTRSTTPSTWADTCCRWSARNSPTAPPPEPPAA
jgi:hypothetical protein